jgi:hypothetical protein
MFNTQVPSPFELLPNEHLLFQLPLPTTTTIVSLGPPPSQATPITGISNGSKSQGIDRELDEETGKRVLAFIYGERNGKLSVGGGGEKKMESLKFNQDGERTKIYVPSSRSNKSTTTSLMGSLFDRLTDSMGLKTMSNVKRITKEVLIENDVKLGNLIMDCDADITEFHRANILVTFQDLLDIGFEALDLVKNRELFNCQKLKLLFGADYDTLRLRSVPFDLSHVMRGNFNVTELMAFNFSIGTLVEEKGIGEDQLHCLQFSLEDLTLLHFSKKHLRMLGIKESRALKPRPIGFGWKEEEYRLLMQG